MKLMFCERCGDITVPSPRIRNYKRCRCGEHAVWWEDPDAGVLRVYDAQRVVTTRTLPVDPDNADLGTYDYTGPQDGYKPAVWIIGLHNRWLLHAHSGRKAMDEVLALTPESYIFKTQESIAIKVRPGLSNDTGYDYLPAGWGG